MRPRRAAGRVLLTALVLLPASRLTAQGADQRAAMMSVVGLDLTSADIVAWCDAGGAGAPMRSAWAAWRTRHGVETVTSRLEPADVQRTRDGMVSVIASTRQKLAAMGTPAAVCPQLVSMFGSESFNARQKFAAAYAPVTAPAGTVADGGRAPASGGGGGSSAAGGTAPQARKPFNPAHYAADPRPTGTVYTASQFRALVDSWFGTPRNYERARELQRRQGTLYLRGRVLKSRDRYYIEDNDGVFASKMSVSPSIDVSPFEGQEITVQGTIDEVPSTMVFLRQTRVVRDPSGLVPSPLPAASGRRRLTVPLERIMAAAGRGLRPADIHGMLYHGYGATGASGYEYREEIRLLLKDGWVYFRDEIAPTDLDVAASRRLEPQQWGRWRATGGGIQVQRHDDSGQPDGEWRVQPGRILSSWAPGTRIAGSYNAAAFYGSVYLGGTYSSTSYVFRPDGRYERIGFSRSSSAAMAAQGPQEFSASASSSSSGSGTQSSAGGGQPGVYTSTRSRTDDGARNRGTYRLDGMMIELRNDAGEVTRTLCLPMGADHKGIYLFGRSFRIKDK
ncbi:MAG: hypothetical protein IT355_08335 [Gemmatimonadaceae bacterium]|nr:hypothetical protein [Gemmatimonadaceae bacterium]